MLGARGRSRGLDAVDEAGGHGACQNRVLGKVLEVASAQGRALDVEAGAEEDVDAEAAGFQPQRLAHVARELGVPGGRERGGRREAGRLFGLGDAQVIGVPELAAHAVRAVAHDEGGDICRGDRAGVPGAGS